MIVRYADDAVLGFEHREDAEQFLEQLRERLAKFGLELHPEVTEQLIDETVDGTLEPIGEPRAINSNEIVTATNLRLRASTGQGGKSEPIPETGGLPTSR